MRWWEGESAGQQGTAGNSLRDGSWSKCKVGVGAYSRAGVEIGTGEGAGTGTRAGAGSGARARVGAGAGAGARAGAYLYMPRIWTPNIGSTKAYKLSSIGNVSNSFSMVVNGPCSYPSNLLAYTEPSSSGPESSW